MTALCHPVLVLNGGSSSIKFSVFDAADGHLKAIVRGQIAGIGTTLELSIAEPDGRQVTRQPVPGTDPEAAIRAILDWLEGHVGKEAAFSAVGHRVVHGGARTEPQIVDDKLLDYLDSLAPLAPLHQLHNVAAIRAVKAVAPRVPQIACFDTAFHSGQPPVASTFALPRSLTMKGIKRYGFHGLSYEYIVSRLPDVAPHLLDAKVVVAHLGNGSSMCAIERGRGIATTMGFTPVDGLPMGTRTGTLDPGVILYLLQHEGLDAAAIQRLIYEQSGLLGVSGLSGDMRTLLESKAPAAGEAVDLFVYRIGRELGSLAAALGGLDALIFTGGIGENAAPIRERVCRAARWLGVEIDDAATGARLSTAGSKVEVLVIPTNENLMVARHTCRKLALI